MCFKSIIMKVSLKFVILLAILPENTNCQIKIGALLHIRDKNTYVESYFKFATESVNKDKEILPNNFLQYEIEYVRGNSSYEIYKKVCSLLERGAQVIMGLSNVLLNRFTQTICENLDVPLIIAGSAQASCGDKIVVDLYPYHHQLNKAFLDILKLFKWSKIGVLVEKHHGIVQIQNIAQIRGLEVYLRETTSINFKQFLKELKKKDIFNILIDVGFDNIHLVLRILIQLQMNEHKYHYIFTCFDIEIGDYAYNFNNIICFRLVDPNDVHFKAIAKKLHIIDKYNITNQYNKLSDFALIYDAIHIYAIALQALSNSHNLTKPNVSCESENSLKDGLSLLNYIDTIEWAGLSGPMQFSEGRRSKFKLDLLKIKYQSTVKIGEWSPEKRLNLSQPSQMFDAVPINVTLVVITILEQPYVMMHYGKNFTGNDRFYGFCVDVLKSIAKVVGFDFILDMVPDKKYGAKDPLSGEWNGMVSQLMQNKADLAVGPITITYARQNVIDFTKPFMNLGISLLFKVEKTHVPALFSFFKPLALDIWIYVLVAYCTVSLTIYLVAYLSQFELNNFHTGSLKTQTSSKSFNIMNCFWFTIGSLMQQNIDLNPKSNAMRILSSIWWFFTLIIIASYTANLAAFLTVERMITPIESAEDLASQTEISYGTLDSGSTMTFFRDSIIETYKKMWRIMEMNRNTSLTSTYEEGFNRVNQGNYAFLMESTMLDYIIQRDCNLTQVGGLLDTKGYGIALPKNSIWTNKLSLAILQLQEKGDIQMLYDKWWKSNYSTCTRKSNVKMNSTNALGWHNIGGVFILLIGGIIVAFIASFIEYFVYNKKKNTIKAQISLNKTCKNNATSCINSAVPQETLLQEAKYVFKSIDKNKRIRLHHHCPDCDI